MRFSVIGTFICYIYRPRTKYEGRYCFHRCLSVNISGGGYSIPGLDGGGGGVNPIPGLDVGGGTPGLDDGGGIPGLDGEGHSRSGWGGGTPGLDGGGYPPPTIRQNSKASTCYPAGGMTLAFHTGGLSCFFCFDLSDWQISYTKNCEI